MRLGVVDGEKLVAHADVRFGPARFRFCQGVIYAVRASTPA
jgi:hypothetical protein